MKSEVYARCGMRCDLCLVYRPNVVADDRRADIGRVYQKIFPGFTPEPEKMICDGCACGGEDAVLFSPDCPTRKCVIEKGVAHCGYCGEYPCASFPAEPTQEMLHQKIDVEHQWTWDDEKLMEAYRCRHYMDAFRKRIILQTDRLLLRNLKAGDADIMYDYRNNELCARYQRGQVRDHDGIVALVERHGDDVVSVDAPSLVAAALKDTDEMVGEIVVMPKDGTISLGYTFSYRHHQKGYAHEALTALIDLLHARYPAWDFICFTDPENEPSMALLKKLGFRDMGYAPSRASLVFGKWTTPGTEAEIARATEG